MAVIGADLQRAKELLSGGDLVAIPTETVYGLAGNAYNTAAVARIFAVKQRPSFDPLIVHTDTLDKITDFTSYIPAAAQQLASQCWPGPLTIILPRNEKIPDLVTSGLDTVAVRIPHHPLSLKLLSMLDFPLAAPSANPFGYISPTTAQHVADQLGDDLAYILDGGRCEVGVESTIISFEAVIPVVYRLGGMSLEAIQALIGEVTLTPHSSSNPQAPGMLQSHYAPRKNLFLGNISTLMQEHGTENVALLTFKEFYDEIDASLQIQLSGEGNLAEAAQNLFSAMRSLDKLPVIKILAETVPDEGLGRAVNDRLRRAAAL